MADSADHPKSYYAHTANWRTNYPPLKGQIDTDVCIVGAGFTGVSAALYLLERGYSVALLEANRVSWGASGRNGGQLIHGIADPDKLSALVGQERSDALWQLGFETIDIVKQRVQQFGIQCDLKFGYVNAALNQTQLKELEEYKDFCEDKGFPGSLTLLDQTTLGSFVGSDHYVGGLVDDVSGHLHPLNLCLGEARGVEQLGGLIYEQTQVTGIKNGELAVVRTDQGTVKARFVVLACNAYLNGLVKELNGMALPAGSYIVATEPLTAEVANQILPHDSAVCDLNTVLDYFRLSADRRLLFGGRCNYSGRHPKSIAATLQPRMVKVFPQLKDAQVQFEWGGNLAISLNRIPQLGRLEKNVFYAQGYSGHGVGTTHLAGRIMADAIAGNAEHLDVFDSIQHMRLPGGKWFASPALALGMLYFRLRDVLKGW